MVTYQSPQDFLERLDSGAFDRTLRTEFKKLSHKHLEQVARILAQRAFAAVGCRSESALPRESPPPSRA
jgi:hypothetical protein